jgi:mono/diheme cytochrome c family protein
MMALVASASALLVCAAAAQSEEEDVAARGKAILALNCGRCHAIGMEDSSAHEEAPTFRTIVTRYPPETLAEALAEGIVSGHPDMPEFVFQPPEIEAILAYLATLQPGGATAPTPAPE